MTTYYHVVESPGMHGSGSRVRPRYTSTDRARAIARARKLTEAYQAMMSRYGGSSGYYRVVTCSERRPVWLGHEIDAREGR